MKHSPATITLEALKAGQFQTDFPKFYALKTVEENNSAHEHQVVLDHVLAVLTSLQEVLKLDFIKDDEVKAKLRRYLDHSPDILTRESLIFLATVFHDIGKLETLVEKEPGVFACPAHELVGAGIAREYLDQIELSTREKIWILQFITLHGYVHALFDVYFQKKDQDHAFFNSFRQAVGDLDAGLLLFVHADNLGSDLKKLNPAEFERRAQAIEDMLGWL